MKKLPTRLEGGLPSPGEGGWHTQSEHHIERGGASSLKGRTRTREWEFPGLKRRGSLCFCQQEASGRKWGGAEERGPWGQGCLWNLTWD